MRAARGRWRFYLVGFGLLVAFDTLAQISFKLAGLHALPLEFTPDWVGRVFGQVWIYGALLGYGGAFVTWMGLLGHAPIGPAFAASHLDIVSVWLVSGVLFGERLGPAQVVGGLAILGGIACLAASESAPAPDLSPASPAPATARAAPSPRRSRHG